MTPAICPLDCAKMTAGVAIPSVSVGTTQSAPPSPYRVSTITFNASISAKVDLEVFFRNVEVTPERIVWTEYGAEARGSRPKRKKRVFMVKTKKIFDNQVTIVFNLNEDYFPNCKLFKNGNIHLTGVRTEQAARDIVDNVVAEVKRMAALGIPVTETPDAVCPAAFKIRMINCDFGFEGRIRRKNLHNLIIDKYMTVCSFQPLTYPGVKLQYYWNVTNAGKDGICHCHKSCFGKGDGDVDGNCKKVTIAIFESGKILITGANTFEQVDDAYRYVCGIIQSNPDVAFKKDMLPFEECA